MNIIFMRHGEATDNVRGIISDKEIYNSVLTEEGKIGALESIDKLPSKIDKIYVSPLPRTIETAHLVSEKFCNSEVVIDGRIREINHGKFSGKQNNEELDKTREKQVAGDYFVRFGEYGENKFDIESRLCSFLEDIYRNNFTENTIMIVSHGSITSFMKRILNIKTPHIKTGKIEEFIDVNFSPLFKYQNVLKTVKKNTIKDRMMLVENLDIKAELKRNLERIAGKEFNNIEFSDDVFGKLIDGMKTKSLIQKSSIIFDEGVILICFYNDFENFAKQWMNHYIEIGVKNFVMIDNNSTDESTKVLKSFQDRVNISFWEIKERYDCYRMCGWRQQIFEFYGINRIYLTVDTDELFVYEGYKNISLNKYIGSLHNQYVKCLMVDVYTRGSIADSLIEDFKFVDKNTYKKSLNLSYGERFYGGPRERIFGLRPSLQKIPLILYTGKEIFANDHFYYPWNINKRAKLKAFLLHYKFLPGDLKKYQIFAEDGRHWNNSREYKVYDDVLSKNKKVSFFNEEFSISINDWLCERRHRKIKKKN